MGRVVESGKYEPDNTVEVFSWPTHIEPVPQPDGSVEQRVVADDPPEGWRVLTSEGSNQQTAVMLDDRGNFKRAPNGDAVSLAPGESIVLDSSGAIVDRLNDDASVT